MSGWRVAIPSHRRAETLVKKTLATLRDGGIPDTWIDVWVAPDESGNYREALSAANFAGRLMLGELGLKHQRNRILNAYPEGTPLVCADDDIQKVVTKVDDRTLGKVEDLVLMFNECFKAAEAFNARLWGLYPATNPMFMKHGITTGLTHIVGSLYGTYADHDPSLRLECEEKEDYERSIKHYLRDGTVVRFNWLSPVTAYYKEPGGMQEARTVDAQKDAVRHLLRTYPKLVKVNTRRKSPYPEILLKDRRPEMVGNGRSEKKEVSANG